MGRKLPPEEHYRLWKTLKILKETGGSAKEIARIREALARCGKRPNFSQFSHGRPGHICSEKSGAA